MEEFHTQSCHPITFSLSQQDIVKGSCHFEIPEKQTMLFYRELILICQSTFSIVTMQPRLVTKCNTEQTMCIAVRLDTSISLTEVKYRQKKKHDEIQSSQFKFK